MRCLAYMSVPELRASDHRPVACTLEMAVSGEEGSDEGGEEEEEEEGEVVGVGGFQQWFGIGTRGQKIGSSSAPRRVEVCAVS